MTEKRENIEKPKMENLELNRETVADLTEGEADQAKGGAFAAPGPRDAYTKGGDTCACTAAD